MKTYTQPLITPVTYRLQSPLLTFSSDGQNGGGISVGTDVVDGAFAKGSDDWNSALGE